MIYTEYEGASVHTYCIIETEIRARLNRCQNTITMYVHQSCVTPLFIIHDYQHQKRRHTRKWFCSHKSIYCVLCTQYWILRFNWMQVNDRNRMKQFTVRMKQCQVKWVYLPSIAFASVDLMSVKIRNKWEMRDIKLADDARYPFTTCSTTLTRETNDQKKKKSIEFP